MVLEIKELGEIGLPDKLLVITSGPNDSWGWTKSLLTPSARIEVNLLGSLQAARRKVNYYFRVGKTGYSIPHNVWRRIVIALRRGLRNHSISKEQRSAVAGFATLAGRINPDQLACEIPLKVWTQMKNIANGLELKEEAA